MRPNEELASVIGGFLDAARTGAVRGPGDSPYTPAELRELRRALSHVASELGGRGVGDVRSRDVRALVDQLAGDGLPPERAGAIVGALRPVYAYAMEQGLVTASPVVGLVPAAADGPSPTTAMLQLGRQLARGTTWIMFVVFVLAAAGLAIALA